jgi:phosphoglycerol transferase MdoB-like AlkP superfamily enzyme
MRIIRAGLVFSTPPAPKSNDECGVLCRFFARVLGTHKEVGMQMPRLNIRSRFGCLYVAGAVFLCLSFLLRTMLLIHTFSSADHSLWAIGKTYVVGLFFDLVTWFYMAIPAVLFLLIAPDKVLRWKVTRYLAVAAYFALVYALLFNVVSERLFWDEFGVRYNFVAVDYLIYTHEVVGNIQESYPVYPLLGAILVVAVPTVFFTRKWFLRLFESPSSFRQRLGPAVAWLVVPVLSALFVDSSWSKITKNHYMNELAMNGLYSLVAAFRNNVMDFNRFYLTKDDKVVFDRVRELVKADNARFVATEPWNSITREITSPQPEKRCNVLIIVVESLSAEFLGAFGNHGNATPNLDALAKECLFFRNFYATGTRTDRGLEAVTLSLPPTPGRSMVKRPHNENLFSIGPLFKERGYELKFMYAGFGYFDNMNTFFEGNGFKTVDEADLKSSEVTFRNVWGVCDEDLYNRVLKECDQSFADQKPFCSVVMTTSNHRPYTYPPKIDIPSGHSRKGAVKYTDYAIGDLLTKAKTKPWFDNTVFVIVADHCAKSAGKSEIPVKHYHIPLFIYAPKIIPLAQVDSLAGQIDVAPTLLGLLNFSYKSKFFGRDILRDGEGCALMGIYQKVALLAHGKLAVLMPQKKAQTYEVDPNGSQRECATDEGLLLDAISYYQAADYLLRNDLYRADATAAGDARAASSTAASGL